MTNRLILITTSRRPTQRMRSLCHDLERVLPNAIHINRGKLSFPNTIERALDMGADRMIVVERWKGGPGRIRFYQMVSGEVTSLFPLLILGGVKTQIDFGRRKRLSKNIALTATENPPKKMVGLALFLSHFLRVPFLEKRNSEEKFEAAIHLSPIPRGEAKIWFTSPPMAKEVGPRLVVRRVVWEESEVNTGFEGA